MTAILRRELLVALRRGAPYALIAGNAILLAGLAAAVSALAGTVSPWVAPAIGATSAVTPAGVLPTLVAWRGATLFFALTGWMMVLVTVVAPVVGVHALTHERRAGTLDELVASGIPRVGLVFAKLVAASVQLGLVLASGLPAFALVWLFGGVSSRVVVLALALGAAYVVFLVALGMLAGAIGRGDFLPAAAGSFVAVLLLIGTLAAFMVFGAIGGGGTPVVAAMNPLVDLLAANREFAEAFAKVVPTGYALPLRPTLELLGRNLGGPLPFIAALGYAALGIALVPLVGLALDPYHPLKTMRLRRSA